MRKEFKIVSIFFILLVFLIAFSVIKKANRDKNLIIVKGKIERLVITTKGNDSWDIYFLYKNKLYKSGCPCVYKGCNSTCFDTQVKGKEISIAIDTTNPSNNVALSTKKEYAKYNLEYPLFLDSLQNCNE